MQVHKCADRCEGCPYTGPKVGGKGPFDSGLVVVAESPGRHELRAGYPLAGPTGDVVHQFIGEDEALFINAMECAPPAKRKEQAKNIEAAKACQGRLSQDVRAYPRKIIIAMGAAAVWGLTGDCNAKITQIRGQLLESDLAEIGILPVLHPAALMRGTGSFRQWKEDIQYALDLYHGRDVTRYQLPETHDVDTYGFEEAMEVLRQYDTFAADIETATLGILDEGRCVIDLGIEPLGSGRQVFRFGPDHLENPQLQQLLEDPNTTWIWHNGKFDINHLWATHGIDARVDEDTMLLSYARDELGGVHDLDTVGIDVLNAPAHKGMLESYLPNKKTSYAVIPQDIRTEYVGYDVTKTAQIFEVLKPRIREDTALERLYHRTLLPASWMLSRVERNGIYVDMEMVEQNEREYTEAINGSIASIQELAGWNINPNSPDQVKQLLFEQMGLPDKAKGSTSKDTLERLPQVPVVKAILRHRRLAKMYGTYVKSMYKHRKGDGRVHPTYLIHGTRTGRLSSREPNMQNIPREPQIRGQFAASPGRKLLEVDLAQAELRALAAFSKDPDLCHVFTSGADLHTEVAQFLFGLTSDEKPTKEQRVLAKTVNFGIIYGRTGYTIADEFGMTVDEGNKYVQGWFDKFPVASDFISKCRTAPRKLQTITTLFGRKKRPGLVTRENLRDLQNEAANFPEQSVASDITLHAAIRLLKPLEEMGVYIINLVHDSILMDCLDDDKIIYKAAKLATQEMTQVPRDWGITVVPFESDAEVGTHWGHTEELKLED